MAKGTRSSMTEDVEAIVEAMLADYKVLTEELAPVPFMQERISKKEYQRRFQAMTLGGRQQEMQRLGVPEVLRLMGGNHG